MLSAVQMHTDLSIPALHMQLFPFMQPLIDSVQSAPCNLTLVAPVSANVLRAFRMAERRYCSGGSEWAQTDACVNTRQIIEIDRVAVDNARRLADMNMQGQTHAVGSGAMGTHEQLRRADGNSKHEDAEADHMAACAAWDSKARPS